MPPQSKQLLPEPLLLSLYFYPIIFVTLVIGKNQAIPDLQAHETLMIVGGRVD